jgi:putative ABC transport system permease protein
MSAHRDEPPHVPGQRWYRRLLSLYPESFRDRYGDEMLAFHRDRWHEERARGGSGARAWLRAIFDIVSTAPLEHASTRLRARARLRQLDHHRHEGRMLSSIGQDLQYALRGLVQRPGFTAVVVVTLTLGIGANAAIFSVVDGILLRPLPFAAPERLVELQMVGESSTISEPEFADLRRDLTAFSRVAAFDNTQLNVSGIDEPERVDAIRVTDGFFETLGVTMALGRGFTVEENAPARVPTPVVMVSDGFWRRRLGADPAAVGRTIIINGYPRTVIGVLPRGLAYPASSVAIVTPLRLNYDSLWTRNNHHLTVIARLAPGATQPAATSQLNTLTRRWIRDYPEFYQPDKPLSVRAEPLRDALFGEARPFLIALLGAVGFVLLIACVNVANLLLARGETRRKELAIRTALGASGMRLARQALTESFVLAAVGGALGLVVGWLGARTIVALAPSSVPRLEEVTIDGRVLAFTSVVVVLTALLFGTAPARRAARGQSAESLRQGGRGTAAGGSHRTRRMLVVAEVALAVVMLAGAGLLVRSLRALNAMDIGFQPEHVLTLRVSLPAPVVAAVGATPQGGYDGPRTVDYFRRLVERASALPGVRSAAATRRLPMEGTGDDGWSIGVDGRMPAQISEAPWSTPAQVTPGYFRTMGVPLLKGRDFTDGDREEAPPVTIVNETMARQLWPGQDPIGHTIKMANEQSPWATVIGVAKDVRSNGFQADVLPMMYFPHAQAGKSAYTTPRTMSIVVRTVGDPAALAAALREAARALDRNVPVATPRTMEQVVGGSIAGRRFSTLLLGVFATLALVLAGIGIYGVIAFAVSQRTYELGLRMALGAQRSAVMRLVVSEALGMTLVGLLLGLAGALAVGRLARSMLVGVGAADVPTYAVVAMVLAGVAILASALPARRATLVSPTEALRAG